MKIKQLIMVALSALLMVPSCKKNEEPQQQGQDPKPEDKEVFATKLSVYPESLSVENTGAQNVSVDIDADGKWTITKTPDWITPDVTEGDGRASISLTVAPNETLEERKASVIFTGAEAVSAILPVVQAAFVPKVEFTASFESVSNDIFKSGWSEGDEIVVFCDVNRVASEETMVVSEISSDGKTAKFVSDGTLSSLAEKYYAYIPGTGVAGFNNSKNWSSANMDGFDGSVPSFCIGKADGGEELSLVFSHLYSVVSFKAKSSKAAKAVFSGNNSEIVNKNILVSFSSQAVNGASAPQFSSTKTIEQELKGSGTYYVGLYPGLNFRSGYTIRIYDETGREIELIETKAAFQTVTGSVFEAPESESLVPETLSNVFDEAHIALTLGVVSDVHINNGSQDKGTVGIGEMDKWRNALQQIGAKANELDKNGVDGILVAGDLIDQPSNDQLGNFKNVYESVYTPENVPMIYTVGNHDVPSYAWKSDMVAQSRYIRDFLGAKYYLKDIEPEMGTTEECRHCVVGGYHILCISPNGDQPITYSTTAVAWLENKLETLTKADPNRYVIVITHPMIYNTVYGSLLGEEGGIWYSSLNGYWATKVLTSVLEKYPQAVVFGGHLHFPLNDPRSAWQGKFTVFGCGSVRYMALESGGYEDMASATTMNDRGDFSQGNVLQFDYNGNMRVYRMDFLHRAVIGGEPIQMQYPTADGANLKVVNHTARALRNQKPVLSSMTATVKDKNVSVTFASGQDDEFVHHYILTLKKDGGVVSTKKILSDFYKSALTSGMKSQWSSSYSSLEDGQYELSLVAVDSWEAQSEPLVRNFTIGAASNADIWVSDDAGSYVVSAGASSVSNDWLSYSDGRVSWTENTTGAVRSASLSMPDGGTFKVTQLSEKEFMGSWKLCSKLFDPNRTLGKGNVAADQTTVTFGAPANAVSLADANGKTHNNNIGISGLYLGAVVDASLEIDYEAKSVRLGLFCDRRSAMSNGNGGYCAVLPECAGTNAWSNYNFAPTSFSPTNYEWLWFPFSADFKTARYVYSGKGQKTSNGAYYICGISIVKATSSDASSIGSSYDVIYQANYNTSNTEGMYFTR